MNKTFNVFSVIALILCIVGALNWMAIGIFGFNFVNWITFGVGWIETLVYILVGVAGLYMILWLVMSRCQMVDNCTCDNETRRYDGYKRGYNN